MGDAHSRYLKKLGWSPVREVDWLGEDAGVQYIGLAELRE